MKYYYLKHKEDLVYTVIIHYKSLNEKEKEIELNLTLSELIKITDFLDWDGFEFKGDLYES